MKIKRLERLFYHLFFPTYGVCLLLFFLFSTANYMTYSNKNTLQLIASLKILNILNFYMLRKYTLKHVHYALCQCQIYNFQESNINNDM